MAMTGFICHDDYYDRLQRLTNEEVGNLFRQLMLYHSGRVDEMTDFIGSEGIAFDFIANDIDRMEEKHNATSETNRINGAKGGRPKKQKEPEKTEQNRTEPEETEGKQTKGYKDKDKDKDIDKEKDKNNSKPQKQFTPPTVDDVRQYCAERGNGIDAEYFVAYYENRDWKLTNGKKMRDWHLAIVTWERNNFSKPQAQQKTVTAQQYSQRDYGNEQDEAMQRMLKQMQEGA